MNRKERLYAVIGGVVGPVLTMVVCSFSPLGAQNGTLQFGEITCTGLNVVNSDGAMAVRLLSNEYGGVVLVGDKTGIGVGLYGCANNTAAPMLGTAGKGGVHLFGSEDGGWVQVAKRGNSSVRLLATEDGGAIQVWNKEGKLSATLP